MRLLALRRCWPAPRVCARCCSISALTAPPNARRSTRPENGSRQPGRGGWARDHGAPRSPSSAHPWRRHRLACDDLDYASVDAVVNLSGELSWSGLDSVAAAKRLDTAALFAIAPGDRYVTVDEMQSVYQPRRPPPNSWSYCPTGRPRLQMLTDASGSGWSPLRRPSPTGYTVPASSSDTARCAPRTEGVGPRPLATAGRTSSRYALARVPSWRPARYAAPPAANPQPRQRWNLVTSTAPASWRTRTEHRACKRATQDDNQ